MGKDIFKILASILLVSAPAAFRLELVACLPTAWPSPDRPGLSPTATARPRILAWPTRNGRSCQKQRSRVDAAPTLEKDRSEGLCKSGLGRPSPEVFIWIFVQNVQQYRKNDSPF